MELFFLLLLIVIMATALGSGFPVAFALPGSAIITVLLAAGAGWLFGDGTDAFFHSSGPSQWLSAGVTNLRGVYLEVERDTLIAIPLFLFMGIMLQRSKIAEDLLVTMARLFGPVPGGLGISVVFVGALLAATTGIVGATVVAMPSTSPVGTPLGSPARVHPTIPRPAPGPSSRTRSRPIRHTSSATANPARSHASAVSATCSSSTVMLTVGDRTDAVTGSAGGSGVGVATVPDRDDTHDHDVVVHLVDDAELSTSGGVAPRELASQRLADAVGLLGQDVVEEVGARRGHCLGEAVGQRSAGGRRQLDAVGHSRSRPDARISARTSSSDVVPPAAMSASA